MRASILAGVLIGQVPEPPVAEPIVWVGPPQCPDAEVVAAAIERRLGRPLAPGEVKVEGQIAVSTGRPRYRLVLRVTAGGRSEVRSLAGGRCSSLAEATAVLVALAVGAEKEKPEKEKPEEEEVVEAPAGEVMEDVAEVPASAPAPGVPADVEEPLEVKLPGPLKPHEPRGPGWFVRVEGGPALGATPGVTGAIALATGVLWRKARLELRVMYLAPRTAMREMTTLRVSLIAGSIVGCARPGNARVEAPLCGGLEAGGVRGDASGPGERDATAPWVATVASAGVGWRAHPRLTLSLALQGVLRVVGPRFELRDPGPALAVFEPGIVSGRLLAGLELRFGDPR